MPSPTPNPHRDPPPNPLDGASLRPAAALPLDELRAFADAVLAEMAKNRDVTWDADGRPVAELKCGGQEPGWTWLLYEVDMSAIGMPLDTPLLVHSCAGEGVLAWDLGASPLARIPRGKTPEETAAALNMDTLLAGFVRFVAAEAGQNSP